MVDAIQTPLVHTITSLMQWNAIATLVSNLLDLDHHCDAKVRTFSNNVYYTEQAILLISDSCTINNGGCDHNATCSHNNVTNAVECKCNVGFEDVGSGSPVRCQDSCTINNGGCDHNATCSHNNVTSAVVCKCNVGFEDVGSGSPVRCQ
ncbi:unnamed protein product, partial [Rotaria sp. Silwood2]